MSKFLYYNLALALVFYLIMYLYKINLWLSILGAPLILILFVFISSKVIKNK